MEGGRHERTALACRPSVFQLVDRSTAANRAEKRDKEQLQSSCQLRQSATNGTAYSVGTGTHATHTHTHSQSPGLWAGDTAVAMFTVVT